LFVFRDAFFFAMAAIIFLLAFQPPGRPYLELATILGAVALGIGAMSKTTYGMAALGLLVIADVRSITYRRIPFLTVSFLFSALMTYLALGQSLSEFSRFLLLEEEMARGHTEGMTRPGP